MKKALLIGVALGLLVGTWAVPATAIDWSARGLIYVTGHVHENVPSLAPYASPGTTPPAGWWNQTWAEVRMGANLAITAKTSDDLYGVLKFNMVSDRWGEPDVQGWGWTPAPGVSDVNSMGAWYKKETGGALSVLIQNAFIDFRVPPNLPVRMRVGVQPIIIRPKVFMFYDGPGISMPITIEPVKLTITPAWYKKWEGFEWKHDDSDVLSVQVGIPIGPVKVGGFFWWENHNTWGSLGVFPLATTTTDADLWWIGANSDGKIGPVGYMLDFVYMGGSIQPIVPPDVDINAWMLRGEVSASLIPGLTFGVGGAYSTGEDYTTVNGERYVQPNAAENWYLGTPSPVILGANGCPPLQDFLMMNGNFMGIVPCFGPSASYLGGPGSIGGLWYIRGFAQYMVTDWMRVAANFGYIGDTSDGGDSIPGSNFASAGGSVGDNDEVGFELDVGVAVNLYKNLVVGTAFGVLFAGDAMQNSFGFPTVDPGTPWVWHLGIGYFF